jgi:hypothetical protein
VEKGNKLPGLPVQLVVWVMTKDRAGCWQCGILQAGGRSVDVENRTYPHTQIIRIRYAGETLNPWGENEHGYLVLLGVLLGFDRLTLEKSIWGDDRPNYSKWRSSQGLLCVSATASIPALHVPELSGVS